MAHTITSVGQLCRRRSRRLRLAFENLEDRRVLSAGSLDPGFGADTETTYGTRGNNFTTIGFHMYVK